MILYVLIGIITLDCIFSLYRVYRRINLYNKAHEKSISLNKELLVIGNPSSGFIKLSPTLRLQTKDSLIKLCSIPK